MRQWWLPVVAIAILLLLGVTGVIFYCHRSQLSYSVDFGSILDAAVFLLVGAFIEYAYSKQSSDKRADTDLLLEIVQDARNALESLEKASHACGGGEALTSEQRTSLTRSARGLSNAVRSIEQALNHCNADLGKLKFDHVKSASSDLNESLTDTPFPGPYDGMSLSRIGVSFRNMRDELTRIAFAINHR